MSLHHCPISACRWSHTAVASPAGPEPPTDLVLWTAATWASLSDRPVSGLATAHVVDAHLVTHSPVEWMGEMRRLLGRIESLEQLCGELSAAVRLPSRAEVEATGIPPAERMRAKYANRATPTA